MTSFARIVLVVALVLFQHGVSAHAIGHLQDIKRDGTTQGTHACETCVAYAIGDVPQPPSQPFFHPSHSEPQPARSAVTAWRQAELTKPFQSQAPPQHS